MPSRKRAFTEAFKDNHKLVDSNKNEGRDILSNSCKLMKLENESNNAIFMVKKEIEQGNEITDHNTNQSTPESNRDDQMIKLHYYYPQVLIDFNYILDVSTLCMLRKAVLLHKYPTLQINFSGLVLSRKGKIDLGHMMLTNNGRNTIVHIEHRDTFYLVDSINYGKLFTKYTDSFSIYRYYNSFVKYICQHPYSIDAIKNIDYLVIYTNAGLELTTGKRLQKGHGRNFFPYKMAHLDFEKEQFQVVTDFLHCGKSIECRGFYKFALDGNSKEELVKNLTFSASTLAEIKRAKLNENCEQVIKDAFLKKLVFAVKQPNREELNSIVKKEIKQYNQAQKDYLVLKKLILKNKDAKIEKDGLEMGSHSNIFKNTRVNADGNVGVAFMWCLHALFHHKNIKALQIVETEVAGLLNLLLTYKKRNIYISFEPSTHMNLSDCNQHSFKEISKHLSRLFEFFVDSNNCEISYFVIYTELVELYDSLCFKSIDIKKKKYKFLEDCGFICTNSVFKLVEENDVSAEFIKLPKSLKRAQESGEISVECIQEMKSRFLSKLVFALAQPSFQVLKQNLMTEVKRANHSKSVSYTYLELEVVSHTVLELYSAEPITKSCLDTLLQDMKEIEIKNQIKFARNIIKEHNLFSHLSKDQHNYFVVRLFNQLKQSSKTQTSVSALNKSLTEANQLNYISLQAYVMRCVTSTQDQKSSLSVNLSLIIYEQNFILAALHTLYTHKHMWAVSFIEKRSECISQSSLVLNYRNRLTYIRPQRSKCNINFKMLIPQNRTFLEERFALNDYFTTYLEAKEHHLPLRYIVVYTNAALVLDEELRLKNELDNGANILQFKKLDESKKKYKVFSACSFIDMQHLFQFSKEEDTLNFLLNVLELGEYEKNYTSEEGLQLKEDFVKKLIFATRQSYKKIQHDGILEEVTAANANKTVPYSFEELLELSLRWLECHVSGSITKSQMDVLLRDIKIKKSSIQKFEISNIEKVLGFVKTMAGKEGSYSYEQLLSCLIHEGRLKILERHNVSFSAFSSIMRNNLLKRSTSTFKEIFDLWFDSKGQKTHYLTVLEENGIRLSSVTSILNKTGANAAKAFRELFNLWFDSEGKKTRFLTVLEKNKMSLEKMCTILHTGGRNAAEAYTDLFNLWFDAAGNKTRYLRSLDENKIFQNICSLLGSSGYKGAKNFEELYNLWFDEEGNKSNYLQILEKEGIKIENISSILGAGHKNGVGVFKNFFYLWFDDGGNRTRYLEILKREGIEFSTVVTLLSRCGMKARETFIEMFNLWFDNNGKKSHYLEVLEKAGLNLSVMTVIMHGACYDGPKLYKAIIDLWFNKRGEKRRCIRRLEKHGITILHISHILYYASRNAPQAFKELYNVFIDDEGNLQPFLSHFFDQEREEERFTIDDLVAILHAIGPRPRIAFEKFHNVCYDNEGKPTSLLRDLYSLGLEPCHLAKILHDRRGVAASNMKLLHNFLFLPESFKRKKLTVIERKAKFVIESLAKNEKKNFLNIGAKLGRNKA